MTINQGRAFEVVSTVEKPLTGRKKSFCRPHAAHGPYVV